MTDITILPEFADRISGYTLIQLEADAPDAPASDLLTQAIARTVASLRSVMQIPDINRRPNIAATRAAFKALGKEPNRYRPSQERLMRRILKGDDLYAVSSLVDAGNLLSLITGNSVGIFDRDKLQGNAITLGVGHPGEPFDAIHRGPLNIASLPVLRDALGPFGTPVSDVERTAVTPATRRILVTIHCFGHETSPDQVVDTARDILATYCSASDITHRIIVP